MAELKNTIVNGVLLINGELIASTIKKRGGSAGQILFADGGVKTLDELKTALGLGGAAYKADTYYQPADKDLTAIAELAGTSGLLKKTKADTWELDTSTYLTTTGTAADSSKLGGVAAASYATQDWVSKNYTNNTGTVTSIAAGTGLTTASGSAITTTGTISLDVAGTKTALGLGTAAYTNSTAYATSTQGSNADTAYGWGNHASANYVTQNTEQEITAKKTFSLTGSTQKVEISNSKVRLADNANGFDLQYDDRKKAIKFVFN